MARMKFLCDAERCIECNACVTACKNENEVPWGVNRRRVVTIKDGEPGERSLSVACMHCSDAPCAAVCPVDCFYTTDDGIVLRLPSTDTAYEPGESPASMAQQAEAAVLIATDDIEELVTETVGGSVLLTGVHLFDLARFLSGCEFDRVAAMAMGRNAAVVSG